MAGAPTSQPAIEVPRDSRQRHRPGCGYSSIAEEKTRPVSLPQEALAIAPWMRHASRKQYSQAEDLHRDAVDQLGALFDDDRTDEDK